MLANTSSNTKFWPNSNEYVLLEPNTLLPVPSKVIVTWFPEIEGAVPADNANNEPAALRTLIKFVLIVVPAKSRSYVTTASVADLISIPCALGVTALTAGVVNVNVRSPWVNVVPSTAVADVAITL